MVGKFVYNFLLFLTTLNLNQIKILNLNLIMHCLSTFYVYREISFIILSLVVRDQEGPGPIMNLHFIIKVANMSQA